MYKILIVFIFLNGIALRFFFLQLNQILKKPDSFAYLQMAGNFQDLSISGFGTGWFGFLYSLPIAFLNIFVDDLFFSAQIINIILSTLTGYFLYLIGKRYLTEKYNLIFIILYFISGTILHYNINVLSETLYMFLFVVLIYVIHKFLDIFGTKNGVFSLGGNLYKVDNIKELIVYTSLIAFLLALMYFTRGEAFIYIISILGILFYLYLNKKIHFKRFCAISSLLILIFGLFISPYIYYLHTITGDWGLTNKGSSNLRQAQMRSINKMDDPGFEKAVGELTDDKHHLVHGFAGGLKYDKPSTNLSLKDYIFDDFKGFLIRFKNNQVKLYTRILPGLIIKDSLKVYRDNSSIIYDNKILLLIIILPLIFFSYGVYIFIFNKSAYLNGQSRLIILISSFFFLASVFFTVFFVLERYFIIFLPFSFLIMVYGGQELFKERKSMFVFKYLLISSILLFSFGLGAFGYYSSNVYIDVKYNLKREAGEWINKKYDSSSLQIAERFPIVTYYSGTKERWIVPYTDNLADVVEYLSFNKVDILVVDSSDFKEYRPYLYFILKNYNKTHNGLKLIKVFKKPGNIVILYKIKGADLKEK